MSGLAKVFLVINLVLAVIFLGTSATIFSVRKDFKEEMEKMHQEYVKKYNQQKTKIDELAEKVQTEVLHNSVQYADNIELKRVNKELQRKLEEAQATLSSRSTELARAEKRVEELTGKVSNLGGKVDNLTSRLTTIQKEREKALADRRKAEQISNEKLLELAAREHTIASLREENKRLNSENQHLATQIKLLKTTGRPGEEVTEIAAKIEAVTGDLAVLTVGKNDKVTKGMTFYAHRGDKLLGELRVRYVYADKAGAEVVYLVDGAKIKEGDDARTSF